MKLHEAIQSILRDSNRPLSATDISALINKNGYYFRSDLEPVKSNQILARVKNYPNIFQTINGNILLVENEIWKNLLTNYWFLVNYLRGIYIVADVQFIIAVLFLYKRLFDLNLKEGNNLPLDFGNNIKNQIDTLISGGRLLISGLKSLEKYFIAPEGIFEECARLLSKLDDQKKIEVWSIIKGINTLELKDDEFGNIFEYFLSLDSLDGYRSSTNNTPFSLRELMVNLLNPSQHKSIYDPVSGTGGLLIQTIQKFRGRNLEIRGTEINKRIAQLGNMNLLSHGLRGTEIESTDCFEEINSNKKYEYIIADLPANGVTNSVEHNMLYYEFGLQPPKSGKSFGSLVLLILSKLKEDGKAVITVSDGFLLKKGKEKEIRDLLVSEDIIETIVSLPYGALRPNTDAKASLLILNRNKNVELKNRIQFLTAQIIDQDAKSLILDSEEILNSFEKKEFSSKNAQIIDTEDLSVDTNLSADAYDAQYILGNLMLKEGSGKLLADLVEIKSGIQPEKVDLDETGEIPLIRIENLSRDILDKELILEQGVFNKVYFSPVYGRAIIDQKCLLVARIGDNLKATIFSPHGNFTRILIHTGVYAIIPFGDSKGIDVEYLYYQLYSSFVLQQIQKRKLGAVMPYISITGLRQIVIPYVDQSSQKSFIQSQKANLISEERNRVEERLKALGYIEEVKQSESDIVRTLVHQLRPTLLNIDLEVNKIKRIISEKNIGNLSESVVDMAVDEFSVLNDQIKKVPNYTLAEMIDKMKTDTLRLSEVLTTVNKVMSFKLSASDFEEIEIYSFFKGYLDTKAIEIGDKYKVLVTGESFIAEVNKTSIKDLIDQLLSNACSHGFHESKLAKSKRSVQFSIRYNTERQIAIIEYQNNGEPFHLNQEDFTRPFHKSQKSKGSGIGGNYIFRIVQAHGGKMNIKPGLKNGFSITFEIPIKQI